ncbi:hypothetical protein PVAND_014694 [Polypedilum vanderplanki]|uniref:Hemolymph juvenile hormone binding protein n=1 Tax=Polypedilum vanderplanki TaxID=319348 RepID=A0A9J6BAG4_POLVA|nr:hypothetical protein PVAND_014694 [Polypedilum vanderplanki]
MEKCFVIIKFLLICGSFASVIGKLPPTIPVCSRYHPNLSECVMDAIRVLQPRLASGDLGPGLKVPSLEPLVIPQIQIGEDKTLKVDLSNVLIHGASKFKIEKLRANYNELKFDALLTIPKMKIFGKYKLNFVFFNQIVKGEGEIFTEFENSKIKAAIKAHRFIHKGQEFARLEPIEIKFQRGKVREVKLSNLFPNNPVLSEVIHAVLKSNPDFALNNVYPQVNNYLSKFGTEVANKIFEGISIDELFPK